MPTVTPPGFDWQNPDYVAVFKRRIEALQRIRKEPGSVPLLKLYYKNHPAQFIMDWGMTADPRNVELGLPASIPFILFPKQVEWCDWVVDHWKNRQPGLTEKSRDMGVSWLAIALSCTLCLFNRGFVAGFGSRKEEYVDRADSPKSLFYKARAFMRTLPREFRGRWDEGIDAPHMRIKFPGMGSVMTGEAGDNIGRGDRASIFFVDESAYIEHPQLVDAALSQTTNCRMDIGTPNGRANTFAEKRFGGKIDVFTFHWKADPRKDEDWYQKQKNTLDAVIVAQEVDLDYSASSEGVVIPAAWVDAAIDAHKKLGIAPTGARTGSLDVADEGRDKNAFAGAYGTLLEYLAEWSGAGSDIYGTTERAHRICDEHNYAGFRYDSDGLGAGVRGDARKIAELRKSQNLRAIAVVPFRGSEAVNDPEGEDVKGRKNADYFANLKAQSWWALRRRFQHTYQAVEQRRRQAANEPLAELASFTLIPDEMIGISSVMLLHQQLRTELSQPTFAVNAVGKIVIDKTPDGVRSPNLADAVMMQFAPLGMAAIVIPASAMADAMRAGVRR